MSHFTKLDSAQITDVNAFILACAGLGFTEVRRNVEITDYFKAKRTADVAIRMPGGGYDLALVKNGSGKYDCIADFWGIRMQLMSSKQGTYPTDQSLQQRLVRDTTRHAIVERYKRDGFRATVSEDDQGNLNLELVRA